MRLPVPENVAIRTSKGLLETLIPWLRISAKSFSVVFMPDKDPSVDKIKGDKDEKPFKEPILSEAHATVLAGIGFVQPFLGHPENIFYHQDPLIIVHLDFWTGALPPHLWTVWLKELLGVVAKVLHHLLLPELLHLPAARALVLFHLPAIKKLTI